jgi:hypothetical protein
MTEPVLAVTYSKRAPLGNISGNLPVKVRQSNRLHVVASAENPVDIRKSGPDLKERCNLLNSEVSIQPDAVDSSSTELKTKVNKRVHPNAVELLSASAEGGEICKEIRSKRVPKQRVPFNVPRVKKKLTLAAHVTKYGPTHDIVLSNRP